MQEIQLEENDLLQQIVAFKADSRELMMSFDEWSESGALVGKGGPKVVSWDLVSVSFTLSVIHITLPPLVGTTSRRQC